MQLYPEICIHGNEIEKSLTNHESDWWAANDICKLLEIDNVEQAMAELDPDDKQEIVFPQNEKNSETHKIVLINMEGVFSLLLQSQAPVAKKFKRWVARDVLFEIFAGNGAMCHIDCSIAEELKEMGLLPF